MRRAAYLASYSQESTNLIFYLNGEGMKDPSENKEIFWLFLRKNLSGDHRADCDLFAIGIPGQLGSTWNT